MAISINPMITTGAAGAFVLSTEGYVQGTFLDDPAMRYQLEGGSVDSSESNPIWGGLPLELLTPATVGNNLLGSTAKRAGSLAAINAWCVFNQAAAMIITPSSNVPVATTGMSVNFMRPGSLARIALKIDPTVIASLEGVVPTTDLYWDPTALQVTTTSSSNYGPLPVLIEYLSSTSKTVTYSSPNATWDDTGSVVVVRI